MESRVASAVFIAPLASSLVETLARLLFGFGEHGLVVSGVVFIIALAVMMLIGMPFQYVLEKLKIRSLRYYLATGFLISLIPLALVMMGGFHKGHGEYPALDQRSFTEYYMMASIIPYGLLTTFTFWKIARPDYLTSSDEGTELCESFLRWASLISAPILALTTVIVVMFWPPSEEQRARQCIAVYGGWDKETKKCFRPDQ